MGGQGSQVPQRFNPYMAKTATSGFPSSSGKQRKQGSNAIGKGMIGGYPNDDSSQGPNDISQV
jgi:hypothetical protein